jgi:hypothetical protein
MNGFPLWTRPARARARLGALAGRARRDEGGAALVQFIAVLPVFVLIVVGLWSMYQVFSAQQTLCDAVWESSRYLQVEGPRLDENIYPYPAGWEQLAIGIINTELKSNAAIEIAPMLPGDVHISPDQKPVSPQESLEVTADNVLNNWFFVQARTHITNPLAIFVPGTGPGGTLNLTCKTTAFYEGPPVGPTDEKPGQDCRQPNEECTPFADPPGGPTFTATDCPRGERCCPVCRPDR